MLKLVASKDISSLEIKFCKERINDETFIQISPVLQSLKNLQSFEMNLSKSASKVTDDGIKMLAEGMSGLTKLKKLILDFSDTQVQDNGIKYIAGAASKLKELTTLSFDFHGKFTNLFDLMNSTNYGGPKSVANSICELKKLTNLTLIFSGFSCKINDDNLEHLTNAIKKSNKWESLTLIFHENISTDKGLRHLASTLEKLTQLISLNLSFYWGNGKITDEGIKILSASFQGLSNLTSLSLTFNGGNNSITDKSLEMIFSNLNKKTVLQKLSLEIAGGQEKSITNDGLKSMCKYLITNSSLRKFSLTLPKYHIRCHQELLELLCITFRPLNDLKSVELDLSGNALIFKDFIPILSGRLKQLRDDITVKIKCA